MNGTDYEKRKLLLLGGSAQQIIAIETAKRLGLYTVLCDYLPDNPGQNHADKFYLVSTTDKEAVLGVAKKEQIDGIIAYASDPAAPTAAYVAEVMGLPTNPFESVDTLCNKDLFRRYLFDNGFNIPKSVGYRSKAEAVKGIHDFNYPILVKPVDSSGSKGVTVVDREMDFEDAVEHAFSFSRNHRIVVEEYIIKKHPYLIGGDIFISKGRVIQWGLMNCHRDNSVNPLVPVGKSYPLLINNTDLKAVKKTLQELITKLGISFGPMNVELIIDKDNQVFPIDIGPRSGGNMIPDLLSMIFGCNVVEMSVRAAMGEVVKCDSKDGDRYFATLNVHSAKEGLLERIEFSPEIEDYIVRKALYKKAGDPVDYFNNAADALGIVFFQFPDQKTMLDMEEHMNEHVKVFVK